MNKFNNKVDKRKQNIKNFSYALSATVLFPVTIFIWLYMNRASNYNILRIASSFFLLALPIQYSYMFRAFGGFSIGNTLKMFFAFGCFFTLSFFMSRFFSVRKHTVGINLKNITIYILICLLFILPIYFIHKLAFNSHVVWIEISTVIFLVSLWLQYCFVEDDKFLNIVIDKYIDRKF